nr:MAG TPA: hypothetical protein [Caudoviricetes sp.]
MTIYEKHMGVRTIHGDGIITSIDLMTKPVITYTVCLSNGREITLTEQQAKPHIDPKFLVNHGKLIASESITSAWGDIHNIFTYELNGEIWYYSYFIDKDGIKHIKSLSKIGEITE